MKRNNIKQKDLGTIDKHGNLKDTQKIRHKKKKYNTMSKDR